MEPIFIQGARLAFPHLAAAHASGANSPPKFGCDLLLAMNDPQVAVVQQHIMACATEEFKEHAQNILTMSMNDRQLRSHGDGAGKVKAETGQPLDGYAGNFFITATNKMMPQMVKQDGVPIDPANTMEAQGLARGLYGGCYVNAAIKAWPQNNQNGRTIRIELVAVQFARDGEAFGAGAPADVTGMFGAVAPGPAAAPAGMGQPMQPVYDPNQPPVQAANPVPQQPPAGMQPPAQQSAQPSAVQGGDGRWYDPQTGQPVNPPQMPGYPGQ